MPAEGFTGRDITDDDISMPQMNEYLYNSLYPMLDINKLNDKIFYYVEDPIGGEEAIGFHTNDNIFTIHVPPSSFLTGEYETSTGKLDANTISFKISGCRVDSVSQLTPSGTTPGGQEEYSRYFIKDGLTSTNQQYLLQLCGLDNKRAYMVSKTNNIDDANRYVSEKIQYLMQISTSLMFVNAPSVVYSSIELLKDDEVVETTYGELSTLGDFNLFTQIKPIFEVKNPKNAGKEKYVNSDIVYYDAHDKRQVWKISSFKDNQEYQGYSYYYKINRNGFADATNYDGTSRVNALGYQLQKEVKTLLGKASDARVCLSTNILSSQNKSYMTNYQTRYFNPDPFDKFCSEFAIFYNKIFGENYHAYTGYNLYGQDSFGRILGVVYLKVDAKDVDPNYPGGERWINLNKYIISKLTQNKITSDPNLLTPNLANSVFKPETYNLYNSCYQDNFWTQTDTKFAQEKKRQEIHTDIMSKASHGSVCNDYDDLYEWTVSIGDVSFFVPPTSIRTVSQTGTERLPLLRTKGSMAKNIGKAIDQIEMDLYFNDDKGINGYSYTMPIWFDPANKTNSKEAKNAEKKQYSQYNSYTVEEAGSIETKLEQELSVYSSGETTYYMDGLRALYSEFRFTPFLPIVNKYINETLEIAAVSLQKLTVNSVPGFPRLLKATLTLRKFDYNIFMPEVPRPYYKKIKKRTNIHDEQISADNTETEGEYENVYVNPFARCINYDAMRYYIQKPILRGNFIARKLKDRLNKKNGSAGYDINTIEFAKDTTYSGRSAFLPYECNEDYSPNIDIYIANEDHLKKLQNIKRDAARRLLSGGVDNYVPTNIQEKVIADWADIYTVVQRIKTDTTIPEANKIGKIIIDLLDLVDADGNPIIKCIKEGDSIAYTSDRYLNGNSEGKIYAWSAVGPAGLGGGILGFIVASAKIPDLGITGSIMSKVALALNIPIATIATGLMCAWSAYQITTFLYDTIGSTERNGNGDTHLKIILNEPYADYPEDMKTAAEECFKKNTAFDNSQKSKYASYITRDKTLTLGVKDNHLATFSDPQKAQWSFLEWCYNDGLKIIDANKEVKELKAALDWDGVRSIVYDLLKDNIRVDSWQISAENNFAEVSLLGNLSSAMQYTGSADIYIDWQITTKDEETVSMLKSLTETEVYFMKKYHDILPSFPIKIDSAFTRLFGIYEVSVEEVTVNTVPNYPGLYQVSIRTISTDRSLRNKESLRALNNNDSSTADGQSGQMNSFALKSKNQRTEIDFKTYNDLNNQMALAELYPDLELPTIGEMRKLGFAYLRYKDKERDINDLFVDPDFYFAYTDVTTAEVIRRTIQTVYGGDVKDFLSTETKYADTTGGQALVDFEGVIPETGNDKFNFDVKEAINEYSRNNNDKNKINDEKAIKALAYMTGGDTGKWDISTKISANFMERRYAELLNLVESNKKQENKISTEQEDKVDKIKKTAEFIEEKLSSSRSGVSALKEYLEKNEIKPQNIYFKAKTNPAKIASSYSFSFPSEVNDALQNMGIKTSDSQFKTSVNNMLISAWVAYTAEEEYNGTKEKESWYGVIKTADLNYGDTVQSLNNAGLFNIKRYTYNEIKHFLNEDELKILTEKYDNYLDKNGNNKTPYYVLDPYYRYKGNDAINEYIEKCSTDSNFACEAYLRIILWYLTKLYDCNAFPSLSFDILRYNTSENNSAREKAKELLKEEFKLNPPKISSNFIENSSNFINKNSAGIDAGKFFAAFALAITGQPLDDNDIHSAIIGRNYDYLNNKIREITSIEFKTKNSQNTGDPLLRRFVLALCGIGEINAPEYIGRLSDGNTPFSKEIAIANNRMAFEACQNPEMYIFHSFYDMIRHDYRGRMLRAFPTFYCIFMDEGREIAMWKLHDNFYSVNAIYDITIAKSRKIAADTCTLTLSNNYQTFTTDDEDGYINYKGNFWGDIFEELLYKRTYAQKLEKKRLAANRTNRAKIQPGIRIHVRIGYGSDARELPCAFNGVIAEVQPGNKAVSVIAQGFGIELMNQILENHDADEIKDNDKAGLTLSYIKGDKPDVILRDILCSRGSAWDAYVTGKYNNDQWFFKNGSESIKDEGEIGFWSAASNLFYEYKYGKKTNPYNIYNFGDKNYTNIFDKGEIVQNIYPVTDTPLASLDNSLEIKTSDVSEAAPEISFPAQGKTIWDVAHICQSVAPEFIVGVDNFRFRNTLFFGKPNYYEAYDYTVSNGITIERRKPYSQYHFIYDNSDIIANNITASAKDIRTVATGLYQHKLGQITINKDVGPLFVDKDIYPEYQKSMLVDTRLRFKSGLFRGSYVEGEQFKGGNSYGWDFIYNTISSIISTPTKGVIDAFLGVLDFPLDWLDEKITGNKTWNRHEKRRAWLATANALKNSIKEMYQGSITIIGSPSIKPHDRIILNDEYNTIKGQSLVRSAVHSLNPITGLTSTIEVDCISEVDSRNELSNESAIFNSMRFINTIKSSSVKYLNGAKDKNTRTKLNEIFNRNPEKTIYENIYDYLRITKQVSSLTSRKRDQIYNIKKEIAKVRKQIIEKQKTVRDINEVNSKTTKTVITSYKKQEAKLEKELKDIVNPIREEIKSKISTEEFNMIGVSILNCQLSPVMGIGGEFLSWLFYWTINNQQVLTIFPMWKNGMTYTAGLEGNLGGIYGSPTFNDNGVIEKVIDDYITPNATENDILTTLQTVFADDSVYNSYGNTQKDFEIYGNITEGKNAVSNQILKSSLIESKQHGLLNNSAMSAPSYNSYSLSRQRRTQNEDKDSTQRRLASQALTPFYTDKIEQILDLDSRRIHSIVSEFNGIKQFMTGNNNFFAIMHDSLNPYKDTEAAKATDVKVLTINRGNKQVQVKGKIRREPVYNNSISKNTNLSAVGLGLNQGLSQADTKLIGDMMYSTSAYESINGNIPTFTEEELYWAKNVKDNRNGLTEDKSNYKVSFDSKGRASTAILSTKHIYSSDLRDSLSGIDLPGFKQKKYSFIFGGYLYNCCHLLGHSLSGIKGTESKNDIGKKNLVTGTKFMNYWMNDVEQTIQEYIRQTNKRVIYKVIPRYTGDNLVCDGLQIMAKSLDDDIISINRFYYNIQPGVDIDYATGESATNPDSGLLDLVKEPNKAGLSSDVGIATSDAQKTQYEKEVYDFPILHKEALVVLRDFLGYVNSKLIKTNKLDSIQNKEDIKGTKVVFMSGIMVNSNYKDAGAGYSFILSGKGKLEGEKLYEIAKEFYRHVFDEINKEKTFSSGEDLYYDEKMKKYFNTQLSQEDETNNNIGLDLPCFEVSKLSKNEIRIKIKPVLNTSIMITGNAQ